MCTKHAKNCMNAVPETQFYLLYYNSYWAFKACNFNMQGTAPLAMLLSHKWSMLNLFYEGNGYWKFTK